MNVSRIWCLCVAFCLATVYAETLKTSWPIKPYRALLVVERWSDPASVVVDHEKDDFQPVAALLKAWSIPFEIFRLDQQHLDDSYLFDREGKIRYGVVVWLADSSSYSNQNLTSLQLAVQAGTSLIVAKSRFLDPALEQILGLKFKAPYSATDPLHTTQPHFITRGLAGQKIDPFDSSWNFSPRLWVEPRGARILITQDSYPILTVNVPQQRPPHCGWELQPLLSSATQLTGESFSFVRWSGALDTRWSPASIILTASKLKSTIGEPRTRGTYPIGGISSRVRRLCANT